MMDHYRFFVDAWRFFKRFSQSATDKDDWWDQMITEAEEICQRYADCLFAINTMCAIQNELERICKTRENA